MKRANCWELMNCGREPGGERVPESGVCPAAVVESLDGSNGGRNGGRACWVVAGTLCDDQVQGTFARKYFDCRVCDFYKQVRAEEGENWVKPKELLLTMNGKKGNKAA